MAEVGGGQEEVERAPLGRKIFVFEEGKPAPKIPEGDNLKFVYIKDEKGGRVLAGLATTFDHWNVAGSDAAFEDKTREEIDQFGFEDVGLLVTMGGKIYVSDGSGELKAGDRKSAEMSDDEKVVRHKETVKPFLEKVLGKKIKVL